MDPSALKIEVSAIRRFADQLGEVETEIEFIRFDDCWRSLISEPLSLDRPGTLAWDGRWGEDSAYGHCPTRKIRPLDFDAWGDPNTLVFANPMDFHIPSNTNITPRISLSNPGTGKSPLPST